MTALCFFILAHKSVMVEVATGAGTQEEVPILIRIPRFDGVFAMLGLGDIVRFDLIIDRYVYTRRSLRFYFF